MTRQPYRSLVLTSPPVPLFQIYPTVGASSLAAVVKLCPTGKVLYCYLLRRITAFNFIASANVPIR